MSSAGRSARGGEGTDHYPTPNWATDMLLDRSAIADEQRPPLVLPGGDWLEPTAGEGAIVRAVSARRSDVRWTACELREDLAGQLRPHVAETHVGDFREVGRRLLVEGRRFAVAVLNPPFNLALPIVQLCLELADHVVALERLPWVEGDERAPVMKRHAPDLYVIGRCNFVDDPEKGGDSIPYAWFAWGPDRSPRRVGRWELLDRPPASARASLFAALNPGG